MTGRERIEAALSPEGTPEIPAVISCYEEIYYRDHWDDLTSCPWWYNISPNIEQQLQWHRQAKANTGQDWFRLPYGPSQDEQENTTIEVRPQGVFRIDRRTGRQEKLKRPPIGGWPDTEFNPREPLAETAAEIDSLVPVPGDDDPQEVITDGRGELARRLLAESGQALYPNHRTESPLTSCARLWGFEGMMTMIATRPDLVKYVCERFLTRVTRRVREVAMLGAKAMWIVDSLTDMISPRAFAALSVPLMARVVDEVRAAGMKSVHYFTGNPAGKWDLILAIGADALALEESKKGFVNDIEDIVAQVQGRCTVFGNLDPFDILERGADEQLRAEVARQIAAGRRNGNRFVMSVGSPVTPDTSVERVRLYCNLVHELGST